jgi:hypothetical protein
MTPAAFVYCHIEAIARIGYDPGAVNWDIN